MNDLFGPPPSSGDSFAAAADAPLAARMRPRRLEEIVGQAKALGPDTVLRRSIEAGELPSLVLWGPPGCGKTTLAACLAEAVGIRFLPYSAVHVGVKELKGTMAEAARLRGHGHRAPVLFLDEIHRFNKAQQDALLPHVEVGDVILVGATTENPSFEVNAALLSRTRVVVLEPLGEEDLLTILDRALHDERGLGPWAIEAPRDVLQILARRAGGDARFALGSLELAARAVRRRGETSLDTTLAESVIAETHLVYDRAGDEHFNIISALHKSLRNSDAQAGIYWLARMLEAGEDPMYVARRLVRFASEDVGLADPAALVQTVSASQAMQQIGMPEGALALAQACVYLAQAPKSNALYVGYQAARKAIAEGARDPVPLHLRNAPTGLMKKLDYGKDYRYAHDEPDGVAAMECLPESLHGRVFYRPSHHGFEAEAAERLRRAWKLAHGRDPDRTNPRGDGET